MFRIDRQLIKNFDWVMLVALLLIATMALVNLYSATYAGGAAGTPVFIRQLYFFLAGLSVCLINFL